MWEIKVQTDQLWHERKVKIFNFSDSASYLHQSIKWKQTKIPQWRILYWRFMKNWINLHQWLVRFTDLIRKCIRQTFIIIKKTFESIKVACIKVELPIWKKKISNLFRYFWEYFECKDYFKNFKYFNSRGNVEKYFPLLYIFTQFWSFRALHRVLYDLVDICDREL